MPRGKRSKKVKKGKVEKFIVGLENKYTSVCEVEKCCELTSFSFCNGKKNSRADFLEPEHENLCNHTRNYKFWAEIGSSGASFWPLLSLVCI